MKKVLILIFIICAFFSLVSCHKNKPKSDDKLIDEELVNQRIDIILEKMSLRDKVGQMFMVGFSGTTIPSSLIEAITNQRFGNFIYFGENVSDESKIIQLSKDIQNQVVSTVNIPAFISIDQEGGQVVRLQQQATHFIGNMGLVATNNPDNAYQVARYSGKELRHYGINVNLAPSLDVNINSLNPVIGTRSFSDDPQVVINYGLKEIKGYQDENVMAIAKHFPGHGDTSVDSHYGLPLITHDKKRLYEVELKPFISAIDAGVDAIMTAHIIFQAFDNTLPATLSPKVITKLLRNELGFNGIIITDEMQMNAIRNHFGIKEAAVKAIQAGVDILLYSDSKTNAIDAYEAVIEACENGKISKKRINESVKRILLKKYKYNLFEHYNLQNNLQSKDFNAHKTYNHQLIEKSITIAKGNINWFSKDKSTLLISPVATRYSLGSNYTVNTPNNSFAYAGKEYLKNNGVKNINSYVIGSSLNENEINNIINMAKTYDQVIIAVENVTSSQATLVNRLSQQPFNLLVVALQKPYDYMSYNHVDNYVCTYGYYQETVIATMDLLLGKYTASGILPVKVPGLN